MPTWPDGMPTIALLAVSLATVGLAFALARLGRHLRLKFSPGDAYHQAAAALVERLALLADVGKREGLLSLEGHVDDRREPLLACGIAMAVDGSDARRIGEALDAEIEACAARPSPWATIRFGCAQAPLAMAGAGAALLLITLIGHAQDPAQTGIAMSGAGLLLFLGGMTLTGLSPLIGKPSDNVGWATLSAILQSRAVMLIASGADGAQVRRQLTLLLPGQSALGAVAQAA